MLVLNFSRQKCEGAACLWRERRTLITLLKSGKGEGREVVVSGQRSKGRKRNKYAETEMSRQIWHKLVSFMRSPCRHVSSSCRCHWGVSTPCPWPQQTPPHWRSSQRSLTWETRTGPTDRSRWPREPTHHRQRSNDVHLFSYFYLIHIISLFIFQYHKKWAITSVKAYLKQRREEEAVFWPDTTQVKRSFI